MLEGIKTEILEHPALQNLNNAIQTAIWVAQNPQYLSAVIAAGKIQQEINTTREGNEARKNHYIAQGGNGNARFEVLDFNILTDLPTITKLLPALPLLEKTNPELAYKLLKVSEKILGENLEFNHQLVNFLTELLRILPYLQESKPELADKLLEMGVFHDKIVDFITSLLVKLPDLQKTNLELADKLLKIVKNSLEYINDLESQHPELVSLLEVAVNNTVNSFTDETHTTKDLQEQTEIEITTSEETAAV